MNNFLHRDKTVKNILKKCDYLNLPNCVYLFLNIRLIICLIIFAVSFIVFDFGFLIAPLFTFIGYFLIEYLFFNYRISRRKRLLEVQAIEFFNLLVILIDSKKSLLTSLEILCNKIDNDLTKIFKNALNKSFNNDINELLIDTKKYIPSVAINNIVLAIASKYDNTNNIKSSIRMLEEQNDNYNKSLINMIPVKLFIVSILFIITFSILTYYLFINIKL